MEIVGYKNYIDELGKEFPDVDKRSLNSVVRHGLAILTLFRKDGHDIMLNNNMENLYYYFGEVTNVPAIRFAKCKKKVRKKYRLVYNLTNKEYPGYYYFGLSDEYYQLHLSGKLVPKLILYKVQDEIKLFKYAKHFFRLKIEDQKAWSVMKENYDISEAEKI